MMQVEVGSVTLPGGARLLTSPLPYAHTVSLGVWVGVGSRDEPPELAGGHHFLEHMLFRGTSTCDGAKLARRMDEMGGRANAFTTKDATCFYFDLLPDDLAEGIGLLADMVMRPALAEKECRVEQRIIQQEIRTAGDNPADLARELCVKAAWGGHALARPILGSPETVERMTPADLRRLHNSGYVSSNLAIAVAGALQPEEVHQLASDAFGSTFSPPGDEEGSPPPRFSPGILGVSRSMEQAHVCFAVPGVSATSSDLPILNLLATILGGGFGSRLFQAIREDRGWAYRVDSAPVVNVDAGLLGVYTAVDPTRTREVISLVREELERLARGEFSLVEVERARKRTIRRLIMGAELTRSHMLRLGRQGLGLGRTEPPERMVAELERLSLEDLHHLAGKLIKPEQIALGVVGPVDTVDLESCLIGG